MTMKTNEIETRVKKIVVEQLGVKEDEVTTDASFVDDLGADSLDTVELVMALEEEFETEIPDEDAEKIITIKDELEHRIERRGVAEPVQSIEIGPTPMIEPEADQGLRHAIHVAGGLLGADPACVLRFSELLDHRRQHIHLPRGIRRILRQCRPRDCQRSGGCRPAKHCAARGKVPPASDLAG